MFTHKDIEHRAIFVINCLKERNLRVSNGELLLEESIEDSDKSKTLTKLPFQKILALFVVGHIKITTPLIEKCHKFGVALIVVKPSFRPVFYWANFAEANFILHQRQYNLDKNDISIAKVLVLNKINNQRIALKQTRCKDEITMQALLLLDKCISALNRVTKYEELMGLEGNAAKIFFQAFYQHFKWCQRLPRSKCDALNTSLDIGYTILFNFIECFLRMFGFDLYVGVYHRMWFKRKSLVCDIIEPFRPIIDKAIRTAWNRNQFCLSDYNIIKGEYYLKKEKNGYYCQVFFDAIVPYKTKVFKYVQSYYRCFMGCKSVAHYPSFEL